jgi:hypothetical protein
MAAAKDKNNDRRKFDIEFIERLVSVEVKVDSIIEDMATVKSDLKQSNGDLKTYISHEINSQKEAIGIAMAAAKEANLKTEAITTLKLEVGNNIKDTMGTEIKNIKDDIGRRMDDIKDDFNKKIDELKTFQSKQTGSKTGVKDFQSWITWIILIVGFILTYFVLRGGV